MRNINLETFLWQFKVVSSTIDVGFDTVPSIDIVCIDGVTLSIFSCSEIEFVCIITLSELHTANFRIIGPIKPQLNKGCRELD